MGIYAELVEKALPYARAKKVKRVCVGRCYTFVEVERLGAGLCYTPNFDSDSRCEITEELHFWKKPVDLVIRGYLSGNQIERAVGLAAINAVLNNRKDVAKQVKPGDVLSEISFSPEDEVLMIGYFESVFNRLKGRVRKVWVIPQEEKSLKVGGLGSNVKVAIITAASLISQSLEEILGEVQGIPQVMLMGPTTPLAPEVFRFTPITWLCGSLVEDAEGLFRRVCEGKGARAFFKAGVLKKVNLEIKK